ncbi:hypothetical protein VPH35_074838 [Triticum aestivum]
MHPKPKALAIPLKHTLTMTSNAAIFVALSLLLSVVATHGCGPYCQPPVVVPTPPVVVPPPYHGGGAHDHGGQCSIDALKLRVCANVLGGLLGLKVGGLVDLDAIVCLCTAVRANVLGIHLDVPVDISLLLNHCGKTYPSDFTCPGH